MSPKSSGNLRPEHNTQSESKFSIVRLLAMPHQKKKEKDCFEKMCDGHLVFKKLKMVKFPADVLRGGPFLQ